MPNTRHIFVSHPYDCSDLYRSLIDELAKRPRFHFQDHSVPATAIVDKNDPKPEFRRRIKKSDVVLVIARPRVSRRGFIKYELEQAKKLGKPIIGIKPLGDKKVSRLVRQMAAVMIDWDIDEIARQIREPGSKSLHVSQIDSNVEIVDDIALLDEIAFPEQQIEAVHNEPAIPELPAPPRPSPKNTLLRAFGFGRRAVPNPVVPIHSGKSSSSIWRRD